MFAKVFRVDKQVVHQGGNPVSKISTAKLSYSIGDGEPIKPARSRFSNSFSTYSASEIFARSPSSFIGAKKRAVILRCALQPASASMLAMFSPFKAI